MTRTIWKVGDRIQIFGGMTTGTVVQATSRMVLCVVLDGVGLALALKRTKIINNKRDTNNTMPTMITNSML